MRVYEELQGNGVKALIGEILKILSYNPYIGLYQGVSRSGLIYTKGEGYVNLLHQIDLYTEYLARDPVRLLIADEIGLGKTVEALRFIKYAWNILGARRILVVAPASLLSQWIEEDAYNLGVPLRLIDKNSIQSLWETLRFTGNIEEGVYIGSMDTLKLDKTIAGKPYYELVSSIQWDVIVVDEAHKLGVFQGRKPSLRYSRIGELCKKAKHCLLLTATPTRGDFPDLIFRLNLLEPNLVTDPRVIRSLSAQQWKWINAIKSLRRMFIIRRTKTHLKLMEGEKGIRIPDAIFLLGLVELPDYEKRFYEKVYLWTSDILKSLGAGRELGLLRAILVKRALSSPLGFVNSMSRIFKNKGRRREVRDELISYIKEYLDEDAETTVELKEPDTIEIDYLSTVLQLPGQLVNKIEELVTEAETLEKNGDATSQLLANIIVIIANGKPLIENEKDTLYPNILVFTEYKDTLQYLRKIISKELNKHRMNKLDSKKTIELINRLSKKAKQFEESLIQKSIDVYFSDKGYLIILIYLSSDNSKLIPLVVDIVRRTSRDSRISTVVLSTDVAGEGLNLQGANILINYEVPWSMIKREQRIGRIWRIGQNKKVYIIDLVRATPLDKLIYEKLLLKIYMLSIVTGDPLRTASQGLLLYREKEEPGILASSGVYPPETSGFRILQAVGEALETSRGSSQLLQLELERIAWEIITKIRNYKAIAEMLQEERPEEVAKTARESSNLLYGAAHHEDALEAIRRLAGFCKVPYGTLGEMLVRLLGACRSNSKLPVHIISRLEGSWELALFAGYSIARDGKVIYELPVLIEAHSNTRVMTYVGLDAIKRLSEHVSESSVIEKGMITILLDGSNPANLPLIREGLDEAREAVNRAINILRHRIRLNIVTQANKLTQYNLLTTVSPVRNVRIDSEARILAIIYNGSIYEENIEETEEKKKVEEKAIKLVKKLFEEKGYQVELTYQKKVPYDMIAYPLTTLGEEELYVEVKGHKGLRLSGVLTENEVKKAKENPGRYIICIVALALSDSPIVICKPYSEWKIKLYSLEYVRKEEREIVHV